MSKFEKLMIKFLSAKTDKNFDFSDLVKILEIAGFSCRVKGSHHIFTREGIEEIINLQPSTEGKAKPYQVKQVRELFLKYKLAPDESEI